MIDIKAKMMADVENYEKTEEEIKKTREKLREEFTYFTKNNLTPSIMSEF